MKIIVETIFRRFLIRSTLLLAFTVACASTQAADIGSEVLAGVGFSDNIARTETNTIDETIGLLGLRFDLDERTARIDANIRSSAFFLTYDKGTFDDEVVGSVNATAEISLIEERLNWYVQNNFGQQLRDTFQPVQADNRENVNFFTTGPNIRFPLGVRTALGADLRYTNIRYEFRPDNNDRASARVWLGRDISETQRLSINAFGERVEYDDPLVAPDFDRLEGFIRWESTSERNEFDVDVGYTELRFDNESLDGPLLIMNWTRTMTAQSTLEFRGGTRFSDQGAIFAYYQDIAGNIGPVEDVDGEGWPFQNNFFDIEYNNQRRLTRASIRLGWSEEIYELGIDRDREILWGRLTLEWDLSERLFAHFDTRIDLRDYRYALREDDDLYFGMLIGYRFAPSIAVALQYRYFQRNSTEAGADFKENRGFLTFTYTPAWGRMRLR